MLLPVSFIFSTMKVLAGSSCPRTYVRLKHTRPSITSPSTEMLRKSNVPTLMQSYAYM